MHALDYASGRCRYCHREWRRIDPLARRAAKH